MEGSTLVLLELLLVLGGALGFGVWELVKLRRYRRERDQRNRPEGEA